MGRVDEQYNYNDPRDSGRNNHYNLWVCITTMVWGQHNPFVSLIRRYSRFRFGIQHGNSWKRFHFRSGNKSSQSSIRDHRNRKRNRHYFYYGLLISLLSINPVKANEGDTNNTSNPVAAATGNVTNQAVQFQDNGAPSRQVYGQNISCNGSTMTFSPFYMGNHTKPWDIDEDEMHPSSYTIAENWGGQLNFMIPLDREGLRRCKSIAARQEEKMRLDYELVRVLKCAELQQKGLMLMPGSRVYSLCSDVVPISTYLKATKPPEEETKTWNPNPFKKKK